MERARLELFEIGGSLEVVPIRSIGFDINIHRDESPQILFAAAPEFSITPFMTNTCNYNTNSRNGSGKRWVAPVWGGN